MGFAKSLARAGTFGLAGLALSGGKKKKSMVEKGPVYFDEAGRRTGSGPVKPSLLSSKLY